MHAIATRLQGMHAARTMYDIVFENLPFSSFHTKTISRQVSKHLTLGTVVENQTVFGVRKRRLRLWGEG